MLYEKKKKNYSEVSDTNKNINSDYYNIFQNEFKKMFSISNPINIEADNNIKIDDIEADNNIEANYIELDNNDIVFINLFSKYIKNK